LIEIYTKSYDEIPIGTRCEREKEVTARGVLTDILKIADKGKIKKLFGLMRQTNQPFFMKITTKSNKNETRFNCILPFHSLSFMFFRIYYQQKRNEKHTKFEVYKYQMSGVERITDLLTTGSLLFLFSHDKLKIFNFFTIESNWITGFYYF
jgi:hypothetical protein